MAQKHGLGRGLGALIKDAGMDAGMEPAGNDGAPPSDGVRTMAITEIRRNPLQPRKDFSPEAIEELAGSIGTHGILQPLLVRPVEGGYELIAGERRYMASRKAGLKNVPVVVREASDADVLALALIENLQREDLNVIEEAEGYRALAEKHGLTQEEIARRVGRGRASVANALRLLGLAETIRALLREGRLSSGHGKVLLGVENETERESLAQRCVKEQLSVRALEQVIERSARPPRKPRARREDIPATHLDHVTDVLHRHFGTQVRVTPSATLANGKKAKGSIEIEFYSNEDLDRILETLGLTEEL